MAPDWGRPQLESLKSVPGSGNLVLYGGVGTGKTHLTIALDYQAYQQGIWVQFTTAAALVAQLRQAARVLDWDNTKALKWFSTRSSKVFKGESKGLGGEKDAPVHACAYFESTFWKFRR